MKYFKLESLTNFGKYFNLTNFAQKSFQFWKIFDSFENLQHKINVACLPQLAKCLLYLNSTDSKGNLIVGIAISIQYWIHCYESAVMCAVVLDFLIYP